MRGKKLVRFKFKAPKNAKKVYLVGDFNNWNREIDIMRQEGAEWIIEIVLEKGQYEYKFLADGIWYNDPLANKHIPNVWGSENSVAIIA